MTAKQKTDLEAAVVRIADAVELIAQILGGNSMVTLLEQYLSYRQV